MVPTSLIAPSTKANKVIIGYPIIDDIWSEKLPQKLTLKKGDFIFSTTLKK